MKKLIIIVTAMFIFFGCQEKKETKDNTQPQTKSGVKSQISNGDEKGLQVLNAWVRPAAKNRNTGVFFKIVNNTDKDITLLGAKSDLAEKTEVHETFTKGEDMMGMREIDYIVIQAGKTFEFKPMSHHIMLINLIDDLTDGMDVRFTLTFKNADEVTVKAKVKENMPAIKAAGDKKKEM